MKVIKRTMKIIIDLTKVMIMESLKDLALTVSENREKGNVIFFSFFFFFLSFLNEGVCYLFHFNLWGERLWYIHDLPDVINNRTHFQLNRIRT